MFQMCTCSVKYFAVAYICVENCGKVYCVCQVQFFSLSRPRLNGHQLTLIAINSRTALIGFWRWSLWIKLEKKCNLERSFCPPGCQDFSQCVTSKPVSFFVTLSTTLEQQRVLTMSWSFNVFYLWFYYAMLMFVWEFLINTIGHLKIPYVVYSGLLEIIVLFSMTCSQIIYLNM